jgi:hypothetical protein
MALRGWLEQGSSAPGWWRGPGGVRAGWRVAMFLALLAGSVFGCALLAALLPLPRLHPGAALTPGFLALNEALLLLPALLASLIMVRLEGRSLASCGLVDARRLLRCAKGFAGGVAVLGALILLLLLSGHARAGWSGLSVAEILEYALPWAGSSLLIGFAEEFTFRGYLLQTLSRGSGFRRAVILTSLLFGALHYSDSGEGLPGVLNAALAGAVFALGVWRTGSLWWSIGFHGGWDYAENFIFGAHDSGQACAHTLLQLVPSGSPLLSGGATGPEGSVLATAVLAVTGFAVLAWPRNPTVSPYQPRYL